jgi:hypothetical protein
MLKGRGSGVLEGRRMLESERVFEFVRRIDAM